jgi:hypothetical protein
MRGAIPSPPRFVRLPGLSQSRCKITPELFIEFVDPAGFGIRKGVRVRHIGFDVENRGAIEEVNTAQMQRPPFNPD